MSYVFPAVTDETAAFTGTLAQNASATYSLALDAALAGVGGTAKNILRGLTVISVQNLAWEVQLRSSATSTANDPGKDTFIAKWSFANTDGVQNDGAGDYLYAATDLDIPYQDADASGKLHLVLVNRSASGKLSGASGYIVVKCYLEPMTQP